MKKTIALFSSIFLVFLLFSINPTVSEAASTSTITAPKSYELIKQSLLAGDSIGRYEISELNYKEVGDFINQLLRENPEIMYYTGARFWSNGKIEFSYSVSTTTLIAHQKALQSEVNEVLSSITKPGMTAFDKVKAVHDHLALTTEYDELNYTNDSIPAASFTAYGALVNKIAVCDGYTKAAQILLNRMGIENEYVDGSSKGVLHAWNLVKLDGHYYFMDSTWDDPVPNKPGFVRYSYFLITSDQLSKDHSWIKENWPMATSTKYSFFHDFGKTVEANGFYYYSSNSDEQKLYKIGKDGTGKQKVNNVRAPYFAIAGDWIYFSNYGNGGYLSKMKKDGSQLQQLNSIHSIELNIIGNKLHFINAATHQAMSLPIDNPVETPIVAVGQTVSPTKKWTVTFNSEIKASSVINQNFVVKSASGKTVNTTVALNSANKKQVFVFAPTNGYDKNTNYTLTIENVRSLTDKLQKKKEIHSFHVK